MSKTDTNSFRRAKEICDWRCVAICPRSFVFLYKEQRQNSCAVVEVLNLA